MDRDDRLVTFGFLCPEMEGRFGTEYSDTHAGDGGHDPTHQCQLCQEGEDSGLSGLSLSLPLLNMTVHEVASLTAVCHDTEIQT